MDVEVSGDQSAPQVLQTLGFVCSVEQSVEGIHLFGRYLGAIDADKCDSLNGEPFAEEGKSFIFHVYRG